MSTSMQKRQRAKSTKKPLITKNDELKEIQSTKNRIDHEYAKTSLITQEAALSMVSRLPEPKKVMIDSNFGSSNLHVKSDNNRGKQDVDTESNQSIDLNTKSPVILRKFSDLPLSTRTRKGLADLGYKVLTKVQHVSIMHTLSRRDLIAVSCTGSGKTLAFVVPMLEALWREQWSKEMGLGALVVSPTRELCLQTFHCIRRVGRHHSFSMAMLIGGTNFAQEQKMVTGVNIVVSTPGRLMHHVEKSSTFDLTNVRILVLDECDLLLEQNYLPQLESLLTALPPSVPDQDTIDAALKNAKAQGFDDKRCKTIVKQLQQQSRQTLLFSATMNADIEKLSQISLHNPLRLTLSDNASKASHDENDHQSILQQQGLPASLKSYYHIAQEVDKVDVLFSFLRAHCSTKVLVFVSTTREAMFFYEAFRILSVKMPVLALHGKIKPQSRLSIFNEFSQRDNGVLFATDIAARGLDIQGVTWVVHFDCPVSIEQFTHRSGRTARMNKRGNNLLLLTPSQRPFVDLIESLYRIQGRKHRIKPMKKAPEVKKQLFNYINALMVENTKIKHLAEKSVIAYIEHLMYTQTEFEEKYKAIDGNDNDDSDDDDSDEGINRAIRALQAKSVARSDVERYALKVLLSIFDPAKYDILGTCQSFGLRSMPVITMDASNDNESESESDSDSDDEKRNENVPRHKQPQQPSKRKSEQTANDVDDVLYRKNLLVEQKIAAQRALLSSRNNSLLDDSDDDTLLKPKRRIQVHRSSTQSEEIQVKSKKNGKRHDDDDDDEDSTFANLDSDDELTTDDDNDDDSDSDDNYDKKNGIVSKLARRLQSQDQQDKITERQAASQKRLLKQAQIESVKLSRRGVHVDPMELLDMKQKAAERKRMRKGGIQYDDDDDVDDDGLEYEFGSDIEEFDSNVDELEDSSDDDNLDLLTEDSDGEEDDDDDDDALLHTRRKRQKTLTSSTVSKKQHKLPSKQFANIDLDETSDEESN